MPHAHYWRLDAPVDGVVHGRCRSCGLERDFPQGDPPGRHAKDRGPGRPHNPAQAPTVVAPPAGKLPAAMAALFELLPPAGPWPQRRRWLRAITEVVKLTYPD